MLTLVTRRAGATVVTNARHASRTLLRCQSTLDSNPLIYVYPSQSTPTSHILTLLKTNPPTEALALGTTSAIPPTPDSFRTNERFVSILNSVIAEHAHADPQVQGQAAAYASSSGAGLFQPNRRTNTGSAGASDQGGAGGGGMGGWVHVSDNRRPPDFGRIAEPEDIFGSVEIDSQGRFVDTYGLYQPSGTYRIVTRDGVLGLPDHLMKKLQERLQVEEAAIKSSK